MKAYEFQTMVDEQGVVVIPENIASELKKELPVRIIILAPETTATKGSSTHNDVNWQEYSYNLDATGPVYDDF